MKKLLIRHIDRIERKIQQLKKLSSRFSWIRLALFIAAGIFAFTAEDYVSGIIYITVLTALLGSFLIALGRHRKVEQTIEKLGYLKQIKSEQIGRIELNWDEVPYTDLKKDKYRDHLYAWDLNIAGERSLFQLLDTSIYDGSKKVLLDWLLSPPGDQEEILRRQSLVQELGPLQLFRDKLKAEALFTKSHAAGYTWTMNDLLEWLRLPKKTGFMQPVILLALLSVSNITLGILALAGKLSGFYFLISFVSYLLIQNFYSHKAKGLFDAAFQMEKLLGSFSNILSHVEQFKVSGKKEISHFLQGYQAGEERPSRVLRRVRRFAVAASLQQDKLLGPIVNLVVPWNLYFSMRLENLKEELEPRLARWLAKFYELEALNSLANFLFLNPGYVFPTFDRDPKALFQAVQMSHPLIPGEQKVANDFKVEPDQRLFLITGSNMAGKSTFLRTVGINLVLAYSGAPVDARSLNTQLFRIFTSININDSLGDGISHFYAEVKRLRLLLDELEKEDELPLFYFVDEIYRGTNNRERFTGSAAFLKEVAEKKGIGMITSHDLELGELEKEIPQLANRHFAETIQDGKMSFEYKIKEGVCPTTNALTIMRMEGLPVE